MSTFCKAIDIFSPLDGPDHNQGGSVPITSANTWLYKDYIITPSGPSSISLFASIPQSSGFVGISSYSATQFAVVSSVAGTNVIKWLGIGC